MRSIGFVLRASLVLLPIIGTATAQNPSGLTSGSVTAPARGPVPPAITAARSIFVSNAGADSGLFPKPFRGDTRSGLQPVFHGFESYRRILIWFLIRLMRISCSNSNCWLLPGRKTQTNRRGLQSQSRSSALQFTTAKAHYILWTLTRSIGVALLQKTHDRNFDRGSLRPACRIFCSLQASRPGFRLLP